MSIKILRTRINNFKVFTDFDTDFELADLVLFDGPNGFGKTTFYDAVELLITGTIKRFDRLSRLVDGRVNYNESPYLNYQHADGDIEIRIAVQVNDEIFNFSRKALNADLEKAATFNAFKLYRLVNFDDPTGEIILDERVFLEGIFGRNYRENFPFLNYVEQEDHTHLLKNTESEKKQHISHLFNVQEFERAISQFELIKKQVGELCKPEVNRAIREHSQRIEDLKKSLKTSKEIQYERLFLDQDQLWDREQIAFSESLYSSWLGERGELALLKAIISNRENYLNYLADERLEKIIISPELPGFLHYYFFLSQVDVFKAKQALVDQLIALLEAFEELTSAGIDEEELDLLPETAAALRMIDAEIVDDYESALSNLRGQRKLATDFEKSLTDLQSSRDRLVDKFISHEEHLENNDTTCPLCGQNWQDYNELSLAILRQTGVLQELVENSNSALVTAHNVFKDNNIRALTSIVEKYLAENQIDVEFVKALFDINIEDFARKAALLEQVGIEIDQYLNTEPISAPELKTEDLINALQELKKGYSTDVDFDPLKEIYQKCFRNNDELFTSLTLVQVETKIAYVEWKYSVFQNELIGKEEMAYTDSKRVYDDAESLSNKLKDIIDVYKKSLKEYNQALIRDIEILFHIYSGRIVQDFQGGLGLFIKEDRGIKFVTDPEKTFDAVFSMSAGQLAALIISFTLALNKKYSSNKILFIDDPVQTMDELNIASFIEVLRSDFGDRQIFISTHEDAMSTFIRYKFKKQGLKTKRINLKSHLT